MTPTDARKPSNHQQVFKNLYFKKVQTRHIKPKYAVGDKVRITVKKNKFEKGFTINWTDKINNPSFEHFITNLQDKR